MQDVSEYTDKIDILIYNNKPKRIVAQIKVSIASLLPKELCAILSGLVMSSDFQLGQELFKDRDFKQNHAFFQDIFELGRRHKISNPVRVLVVNVYSNVFARKR